MTLSTGKPNDPRRAAFTLVELIIVMGLLVVVISVAAPSLGNFFRGRALDSEARQLLALTHAGQSRAVSEGVPMILWVDAAKRAYGLEKEPSFEEQDGKAESFLLDTSLQMDAAAATTTANSAVNGAAGGATVKSVHGSLPQIRFLPDGSVDENSLSVIRLVGSDGAVRLIAPARNRLNYEIRSSK